MSDIQEQIKLAHKKAEENDIKLLKEELEELREDNYAYHQLMKMENEREYRSKFLKEFQEEFGKNVFPDYDEIYKRYDKLKKENKQLKELCDKYEEEHKTTFEEWKKDINIIDEFDKWLIGEKMMFYKSNDGERLIRFGETKNKWLELKGDNK